MKKEELIIELLKSFKTPEIKSKDKIWKEIEGSLNNSQESNNKVFTLRKLLPLGAAACIALGMFLFWPSNESFVQETKLESKNVTLPDGSSIELGPNSKVSYSETDKGRIVDFQGEGFFDVVKNNQTFIVKSNEVEVTVLGTSFNVFAKKGDFDVKCFTGKVGVKSAEVDVKLTPGKGVNKFNKDEVYNHNSKLNSEASQLSFDHAYLNSALLKLKAEKKIEIINVSGSNPVISYDVQGDNPEDICEVIALISGLKYKKLGEKKFELY